MKNLVLLTTIFFISSISSFAQLTTLPNGGNKKAIVSEKVGLTDVTINYNRPSLKGREGKIWGTLVPYGFNDLGFGTSKAAPWRAGANENTTISFSSDVTINGNKIPAGKYGFFIAPGKEESILIFSKNNGAWGSYFYNQAEDALRITVKQQMLDKPIEFLEFVFLNQTINTATVALQWEKLRFPFTVEADVNTAQISSFRNELKSEKGFDWQAWAQAANWTAENNTNLEEGLEWANYAISGSVGEKNFTTLSTKAKILDKMGNVAQAEEIMKEATPLGNMQEVHNYARQLLNNKKTAEAALLFKTNYKKFPNQFTTNMGMVRAFSSEANYKEALKYADAALLIAPDENNKKNILQQIEKLKKGQNINM